MSTAQAPGSHHRVAAIIIGLLRALLARQGWMTTSDLASSIELDGEVPSRDQVRRILYELTTAGLVRLETTDEGARWQLGPALPSIAFGYLELLAARQRELQAEFALATLPHAMVLRDGRMEWRVAPDVVDPDIRDGLPAVRPPAPLPAWTPCR